MTWIIENDAFSSGDILLPALKELKKDIILWDDNFWNTEEYKSFPKDFIFHGSLGNLDKVWQKFPFHPWLMYNKVTFSYSTIDGYFHEYLLNKDCMVTSISEVLNKLDLVKELKTEKVFARPESPLKEFSGRILPTENLTPAHFDYGFYHEDINLPIILAPVKSIEKEYRFICVDRKVVTGCEYIADGRKGGRTISPEDKEPSWDFAQQIADEEKIRETAYIIDVCLSNGNLYLVEINPFSGADLYNCDAKIIIESIEQCIRNEKELLRLDAY